MILAASAILATMTTEQRADNIDTNMEDDGLVIVHFSYGDAGVPLVESDGGVHDAMTYALGLNNGFAECLVTGDLMFTSQAYLTFTSVAFAANRFDIAEPAVDRWIDTLVYDGKTIDAAIDCVTGALLLLIVLHKSVEGLEFARNIGVIFKRQMLLQMMACEPEIGEWMRENFAELNAALDSANEALGACAA